ncbi:MAG: Gfo/Idh/MocA family oxidoreductase [Planctomycetota bacterium]|nr:Gfo/Idh/MocA family oxidoreductase [Planctomycetota bacterium]
MDHVRQTDLTRRRFLKSGVAGMGGVAGILATGSAPAFLSLSSSNDVLRMAVVGTGGRGIQHLKALGYFNPDDHLGAKTTKPPPRMEGVEVVALCDAFDLYLARGMRAVRASGGKATGYTNFEKMLDEEQLDGVILATPDHLHAPHAIAAMEAGKDVYVEKCMANSIEEANALGEVVHRTGRILQVGHQHRQNRMQRVAKQIIERGDLGEVTMVQAFLSRGGAANAWIRPIAHDGGPDPKKVHWKEFLGPAPDRPYDPRRFFEWRCYWDYSTGPAGDMMSHTLDAIHDIMGLTYPASAVASGGVYFWKDGRETPDTYSAALEYPDNDLSVTYSCNMHNNYQKRATLFLGSEATLELNWEINVYADRQSELYKEDLESGKKKPGEPFIRIRKKSGELITEAAPTNLWLENQGLTLTERDGMLWDTTILHHLEFADCIRNRATPSASFDAIYPPTVATHMTVESYKQGKRIHWDGESKKGV